MHDEPEPIQRVRPRPRVGLEEVVRLERDALVADRAGQVLRPVPLALLEVLRAVLEDDAERRVRVVQHPQDVQRHRALPRADVDERRVWGQRRPRVVRLERREVDVPCA